MKLKSVNNCIRNVIKLGKPLVFNCCLTVQGHHSYQRDYPCWNHTRWVLINSNISAPVYSALVNIKLFTINIQTILSTVQDRLITMYAYSSWFRFLYINVCTMCWNCYFSHTSWNKRSAICAWNTIYQNAYITCLYVLYLITLLTFF